MIQSDDSTVEHRPPALPENPELSFDAEGGARRTLAEVLDRVSETVAVTIVEEEVPRRACDPAEGNNTAGPYLPSRPIGSGGGGVVWEALQASLGRTVAIKKLHDPLEGVSASKGVEEAFRREAFTTAALEHPNIIPVYDLGTDEHGRPMLSMKLVRGEPWNRVLTTDSGILPAAELLAKHLPILADVVQAVAFAHDRGVIHRDLKPSQVMLGRFGEVLLMDWGLAVAVGGSSDPSSSNYTNPVFAPPLATATSPAGTPAFMAPEQTLGHCGMVGTWTDVYLLGGILYLLLTGKPPHDAPTSLLAFRRAQLGEVTPPSERAPGRSIPADLEKLAMDALQPEPSQRVPSAEAFLVAIQEHLTGVSKRREAAQIFEAVSSRLDRSKDTDYLALTELLNEVSRAQLLWPESTDAASLRERLLEMLARQALAGGDLVLARLTTQQVGAGPLRNKLSADLETASLARRRRESERAALRWATAALLALILGGGGWFIIKLNAERRIAQAERDAANIARMESERNLAIAQRQGDGAYEVIEYVLRDIKIALEEELSIARGITIPEANEITHAVAGRVANPVLGYFTALTPDELDTWPERLLLKRAEQMKETGLRFEELGRLSEGLELAKRSLAIREKALGPEHPDTAESLNSLAALFEASGDYGAALPLYKRALSIREKALGPEHPDTAASLTNLAYVLDTLGDYKAARPLYERGLEVRLKTLGPDHPDTANSLNNLAFLLDATGDSAAARPLFEHALAIREKALGPDHPETANSLNNLAFMLDSAGDYDAALPLYERALTIWEKVRGPDHPATATCLNNLAALHLSIGNYAKARELFARALAIKEKALGPTHPDTAISVSNLGSLLDTTGDTDAALPLYQRALSIRESALGPEHPDTIASVRILATFLEGMEDYTTAMPYYERLLAHQEKQAALDPTNALDQRDYGIARLRVGYVAQLGGNQETAHHAFKSGLAVLDGAGGIGAETDSSARALVAAACFHVGRLDDATSHAKILLEGGYAKEAEGKDLEVFSTICRKLGLSVPP